MSRPHLRLTLVVTTYERPDALAAVLATAVAQDVPPHELLVVDDGSGAATRAVTDRAVRAAPWPVRHLWQPHEGFRLTRLRNLAIAEATGDYLVFVDGDMLLHPAFVADHVRAARSNCWTQGVRIAMDERCTARMLGEPGLTPGAWARGLGGLRRTYALHAPAMQHACGSLANGFIAVKGCNQGFWRADLEAVNGFNEEIVGWGPEDKELVARLERLGRMRRTLLFGGIAWHLHHPPAPRERRAQNEAIYAATLQSAEIRCARGLDGHRPARQARPSGPASDPMI